MEKEIQQLKLFERVKKQARWVFVEQSLKEDLIHEAYLLAVEYAEKHNKPLSELSKTEIKLRCFEAARKLRLKERIALEDLEEIRNVAIEEDFREKIIKAEEEKIGASSINKIEWVLQIHPKLKLAPRQREIYEELKKEPAHYGWRMKFAQRLGVSRQDIWNTERIVKQKFILAKDLVELWNGNIREFFIKYGRTWRTPLLEVALRPLSDLYINSLNLKEMRSLFGPLQENMFRIAIEILSRQANHEKISHIEAEKLTIGYHLLCQATQINPPKANPWLEQLKTTIPKDAWLINRFIRGRFRLMDDLANQKFNEWLKYLIRKDNDESNWCVNYIACRVGATDAVQTQRYLKSQGKENIALTPYGVSFAVKEFYKTFQEAPLLEREGVRPIWFDGDFLFLLFVLKRSPTQYAERTKNTLKIICRQVINRSEDPFVVKEAEKLLMKVRNREIISM